MSERSVALPSAAPGTTAAAASAAGGTRAPALQAVLPMWLDRCRDMQGRYRTALCTAAVVALLDSHHPALDTLQVKSRQIFANAAGGAGADGGVRTRSQAAREGAGAGVEVQVRMVPAWVQLAVVLAEVAADLEEAKRSRGAGLGLDPDLWDDEEDDEEEEEEEGAGGGAAGAGAAGEAPAGGLSVRGASYNTSQERLLEQALGHVSHGSSGAPGLDFAGLASGDSDDGGDDFDGEDSDGGAAGGGGGFGRGAAAGRVPGCSGPGDALLRMDLREVLRGAFERLAKQRPAAVAAVAAELSPRATQALAALMQQATP